jgi:serine/threonine protein kinase/Tfp pilus assembly protein PilF
MSEDQRPPDDPEPTRLDSADLRGGADDTTRADGERLEGSPTGKRLGDFELLREIGRGGMGVVYAARQVSLDRRVALKVLPPALGLTGHAKQRFEREARAAAKLHHTNIVPVHAVGEHDDHHFYAMDLIEGQSLDRVLRQVVDEGANSLMETTVTQTMAELRPRPTMPSEEPEEISLSDTSAGGREWFDTVAKLMAEVADGLHYAHGRGIIHRDIKPANLMLSKEGRLCVTDFGLARVLQEPGITVTGSFLGTPAYMSPEQIKAERVKVDHRTDVYSLGVVLYEMLTLQRPFPGKTREEILNGVLNKDPKSPRHLNTKIPVDLETICLKALEKEPDRRYSTAAELANDLRQYLQHGLIAARRAGLILKTVKWTRRHPTMAVALLAAFVIAVTGVVAWWAISERSAESARRAVSEARLAIMDGEYRRALESADVALAAAPGMEEAWLLRARMLIKLDRQPDAAQEAASRLEADPANWTAHLILAILAKGDWDPTRQDPTIPVADHVAFVTAHAPESADAYYLRSLVADEPSEALELAERALALDPRHADALLERIQRKGELKDLPSALEDCERLALIRPNSSEVFRVRAYLKGRLGDGVGALTEMEQAVKLDPTDPVNFEHRAVSLYNLGKHEEALDDLTRAIEIDPDRAPFYWRRGNFLGRMTRYEEAEMDLLRALELDPDYQRALTDLLVIFRFAGDRERASEAATRLLAASEDWKHRSIRSLMHRHLSNHYLWLGNTDEALAETNRAIEATPDDPYAYLSRTDVYLEMGDKNGFEADCDAIERIVSDATRGPDVRLFARNLAYRCRRWDSAIEILGRLSEDFPHWYESYMWSSDLKMSLGNLEDALLDADKTIEVSPRAANAYHARAAIYERMRRLREALADQIEAVELNPYDGWSRWALGTFLFYAGRFDEALEECEKSIELAPLMGLNHCELGGQLAHAGKCDEAVAALERAREVSGRMAGAERARHYVQNMFYACPDAYDSAAVVEDIRASLRKDAPSRDVVSLSTLGTALYHDGKYHEARQPLLDAQEISGTESSYESFVLAMIAWKLGDTDEARSRYTGAVDWMERYEPANPVLINLRKECEAVITGE